VGINNGTAIVGALRGGDRSHGPDCARHTSRGLRRGGPLG
jgi:hypothetical protein